MINMHEQQAAGTTDIHRIFSKAHFGVCRGAYTSKYPKMHLCLLLALANRVMNFDHPGYKPPGEPTCKPHAAVLIGHHAQGVQAPQPLSTPVDVISQE
jgi:hypothetical protein